MNEGSTPPSVPKAVVLEDDRDLCDIVVSVLRQGGFDVEGYCDAKSAIEAVMRWRPDVVLTDLRLVGMDGFELCRKLAKLVPHTPVVVLSGERDARAAALAAGAKAFLRKPVEMDELLRVLHGLAAQET
jgi:DNA-binding response OmpR family regulator